MSLGANHGVLGTVLGKASVPPGGGDLRLSERRSRKFGNRASRRTVRAECL